MGNKTSRRIAGVFLSLVMLLSLLPTAVFAETENTLAQGENKTINGVYCTALVATTYTTNENGEANFKRGGILTNGTLHIGDYICKSDSGGNYRVMFDDGKITAVGVAQNHTVTINESLKFTDHNTDLNDWLVIGDNTVTIPKDTSLSNGGTTVTAFNNESAVVSWDTTNSYMTLISGSARVCGTLKVGNHTFSTVPTSGSSYTYTNFIVDANGTSLKLAGNGTVMMDGTVYLSGSSDNTFTIGSRGSNTAITVPDGATVSAGTNSVTGKTESGVDAQVEITDNGSKLTLFAGKGESTSQMKVEKNGKSEGRTYTKQSGDGVYEAAVNDATLKVGAGVTVRDGNTKANFTNINSDDVFTFTAWNTVKVPKGTKVTKGSYEIQGAGDAVVTTDGEEDTALTLTSGSGSSSSKMLAKVTNGTASFEAKNTSTTYTVDTNNHKLTLNANGKVKVTVDGTDFVFANNSNEPETFEFKNGIITVPKQTSITSYNNSDITSSVTGGGGAQVTIESGVVVLTSGKGISTGTMVTKLNGDKVTFVGNGKQFTVDATANAEKQLILSKDAVVSTTVNSERIEIASTANDKQLGFKKDSSGNITMDVPKQTSVTSYDDANNKTSSVSGNNGANITIEIDGVVLTSGSGKTTGTKMVAKLNNVNKTFESTGSYTVNATASTLTVPADVTVTDNTGAQFTGGTFTFNTNDISVGDGATISSKATDGNGCSVTGVNGAVVTATNGNVVLTAGEGKSTSKIATNSKTFTASEGNTSDFNVSVDSNSVIALSVPATVTVTDGDGVQYTGNGTFTFNGTKISLTDNAKIAVEGSNITNVNSAVVKVGSVNDKKVLILDSGIGKVTGVATVYAEEGSKRVRIDVKTADETAEIDLNAAIKAVRNLAEGKSVTIDGVTYTAVSESMFPLKEAELNKENETATVPGNERREVIVYLNDSGNIGVTIPGDNNSDITVAKTAEGGTVTVTSEGGYFTVNEKTYTAGSDGAVFTVAKNGNVYITSGTATLDVDDSVFGGVSGKEIKNAYLAGGSAITVTVSGDDENRTEIVTLPEANDKVSIGTHVYTAYVDNTKIAVTDNNQLIMGAVKLVEGESIYGKSGKYIENPTGGTADEIIVSVYGDGDSVKVDPYRQVIIGGATYTASNEGVTLAVSANGSVRVIAGSLQTYHRHKSAVDANKTSSTTTTTTDGKKSPTTFDAGVGIYAVSAILSVTGMAWVGKKKF